MFVKNAKRHGIYWYFKQDRTGHFIQPFARVPSLLIIYSFSIYLCVKNLFVIQVEEEGVKIKKCFNLLVQFHFVSL